VFIIILLLLLLLNGGSWYHSPRFTHTYDSSRHRFAVITTTPCGFLEWSFVLESRRRQLRHSTAGTCEIAGKILLRFYSLFFYRCIYIFLSRLVFFFSILLVPTHHTSFNPHLCIGKRIIRKIQLNE